MKGAVPSVASDAAAAIANMAPIVPAPMNAMKDDLGYADPGLTMARPPAPGAVLPSGPAAPAAPLLPPGTDLSGLSDAIALYRKGNLAGGDALARQRHDDLGRTLLEWVALRTNPRDAGLDRFLAFIDAHRDWPSLPWLRRRVEEALFFDRRDSNYVASYFANTKPLGPFGELALARVRLKAGQNSEAAALVREVWRNHDLDPPTEAVIVKEFSGLLTLEDDKFRADRLLYEEQPAGALRAAARTTPELLGLARARATAITNRAGAQAALDAVPAALRKDPGYQFSRIQLLRRADKVAEAAQLLLAAPRDQESVVDGDAWWAERRMIARRLLDKGDPKTAYRICAENSASSPDSKVDAEFHAGWIALRFLGDPADATAHFAQMAAVAETPDETARAGYWQARAAEAAGDAAAARRFYAAAAAYTTNFYGQLARARLGLPDLPIRHAAAVATGEDRHEAVKVVELLYALKANDLAMPLVIDGAQRLPDAAQVAALGAVVSSYGDARAALLVGKLAANRGVYLDDLAFPTFGIPDYEPVANSADRAVVYAIARQESAFQANVVSGAGAKGLMQLLTSTARETAKRVGIAFDEAKLTSDASFNAKLGAAFLGALLGEQRGSYILAFAAYNAGGGRVQQWINAYGDPRDPKVDPVDWIEQIPIDETRNYVQQIVENFEVYRRRFGEASTLLIDADLRRASTGL